MEMGIRIIQTLPCPVCGFHKGHYDGCEKAAMEELQKRIVNLPCPKCSRGKVGVNETDYYECRACHTQFSTSGIVDCENPDRTLLLDARHDQIIPVLVLQRNGEGKFPLDQALKELRERLVKRRRTSVRKR